MSADYLSKPEEIANAVLYFASVSSGFTTGQTLKVDGGWVHIRSIKCH